MSDFNDGLNFDGHSAVFCHFAVFVNNSSEIFNNWTCFTRHRKNNLTSCRSMCAFPPLDLQADSRACVQNGGAFPLPSRYLYLDLSMLWGISAEFICVPTLADESSLYKPLNPPFGSAEMDIVTSALVLCYAKWGACSLSLTRLVCVPSQKEVQLFLFSPCLPGFLWRPLIFCMHFETNCLWFPFSATQKLCFSFETLAMASHEPICL